MKIFIIHNYYQHKGGEDMVFMQETEELKASHEVETMTFKNKKGYKGLFQFLLYPWNILAANRILKQVSLSTPDIVHIHNIHYAIGPYVFKVLHKRNIPVIMTLHNFRILDPSATLFHNGQVFTDTTTEEFPWKSVQNKVLDNSWLKTFWTAFTYFLHKKVQTWKNVDRYLVLSNFAKELLIHSSLHLSPDKITVKSNFVKPSSISNDGSDRQDYFVYIGRLSEEKGIMPLLRAFSRSTYTIKICGDGPFRKEVESYAARCPNIEYIGFLAKEGLDHVLYNSQALIIPSICYEGMPIAALEAFSNGTPVIASALGILKEMVREGATGLYFKANDEDSLLHALDRWQKLNVEEKALISENCKKEYWEKYSPQKNVLLLESIYQEIITNYKK